MKEKEIILEYARERFYREGFNKISMDEISSQLHMSKKTIYKHFPSKDKLIEDILVSECECHMKVEDEILSNETGVIRKIALMVKYNLSEFSKLSEKWINDLQIQKPELWKNYTRFKNIKHEKNFKKILTEGKKEKLIKDIPLELILAGVEAIVKNILHSDFLKESKLSFKQALSYSLEIYISGLLTIKGLKIFYKEKKLLKI
jgi:AcrR family transcriptional regulator